MYLETTYLVYLVSLVGLVPCAAVLDLYSSREIADTD